MVQQALDIRRIPYQFPPLNRGAEIAQQVEVASARVPTEQDRVCQVQQVDFCRDLGDGIGRNTVVPVGGDLFGVVKCVATLPVTGGAEKRRYGRQVRFSIRPERREELVKESSRAVKEYAFGPEIEVRVLGKGLLVSLVAVESQVVPVKVALAGRLHHPEECTVEAIVVAASEEVVVPGKGGVSFEFLEPAC